MPVRNDMMMLSGRPRTGLWAYYAERFAEQQGCELDELGAVLLQKTPAFELHEVHCKLSANLLLKCQGGICQGVR